MFMYNTTYPIFTFTAKLNGLPVERLANFVRDPPLPKPLVVTPGKYDVEVKLISGGMQNFWQINFK